MKKDYLCHKLAINNILRKNKKDLNVFNNNYVNEVFKNLVKESEKTYNLISENGSLNDINNSLDKKRDLSKLFKELTGIEWNL